MIFAFGSTLWIYCYFGCFFFRLLTTHALTSNFEYSLLFVSFWLKLFLWNWSCNIFRATSEMVFLISFFLFHCNIIWATLNVGMEKLSCKERHKKLLEKYIKFIAAQFPATSVFVTCQLLCPFQSDILYDWSLTWTMRLTFTNASLKIILVSVN